MRRVELPLLLALLILLGAAGAPRAGSGQESRVYAVWPHSDYKPWQSDIYARNLAWRASWGI